ncbi:hypothetical protein [Streptomyces massasporeus]|uniref:hypothetical protein n=1 Tax=Streptomyces massasporeus TaxID=67324 RepID=UPI00381D0826
MVAPSCTLPTAPAQAAPRADEPAGTVRPATEKRRVVDAPRAATAIETAPAQRPHRRRGAGQTL